MRNYARIESRMMRVAGTQEGRRDEQSKPRDAYV
jgi:hypothetical protein